MTPRTGRFNPGNDPILMVYEAGWTPGPVWTGWNISPPPGFAPLTAQPVASSYTY